MKMTLRASATATLIGLCALGCESQSKPGGAETATTAKLSPTGEAAAKQAEAEAKRAKPASGSIVKGSFGAIDGEPVERYTLTNQNGLVVDVIAYGATVTRMLVPDRKGELADVVLGFDDLNGYLEKSPYFGATVGRVANRIGGARFELDGKKYQLAANNGKHHLHGGQRGWDKLVWSAKAFMRPEGPSVELSRVSPDGEEGYPGQVQAKTVYTLTNDDALKVVMTATTSAKTIVNMAHHSYWNLGGHASGTVEDHELRLYASSYTPAVDLVPDGRIRQVEGSPFDFSVPKLIGRDLEAAGGSPAGFDHNWVVDGEPKALRKVARLTHPASGRIMTIEANQPGVQFYSGNFLDGKTAGKEGKAYEKHAGLCLETQAFPNSINVPEWRSQVVLEPGKQYEHVMIHHFSAE